MFDLKSVYTLEINNYNRLIDIINNRKKDYLIFFQKEYL